MKTIMLVEDEQAQINILGSVLAQDGYVVKMSLSAEEALESLRTEIPDLIVSDVQMGEMDGFALLEKIHTIASLNKTPFVFLTALHESQAMKKARELGAAAYFTKPVDVDEFLRSIRQLVPP